MEINDAVTVMLACRVASAGMGDSPPPVGRLATLSSTACVPGFVVATCADMSPCLEL